MAATDFDFAHTRNEIVNWAYRLVGAIGADGAVTPAQWQRGANLVNFVVKRWQAKRTFFWTQQSKMFTVTAGSSSILLDPADAIIGVDCAFYRDADGYDSPIKVRSYKDYFAISEKALTGPPEIIVYTETSRPQLFVWPVPDVGYSIYILFNQRMKDWDSVSSTGDFEATWGAALAYGCAAILCDEYGLPISERNSLKAQAEVFFQEAKQSDRTREDDEFVTGAY